MNKTDSTDQLHTIQSELSAIAVHIKKITQSILNDDTDSPLQGIQFVMALGWSYKKLLTRFILTLKKSPQGQSAVNAFHSAIKQWILFAKDTWLGKNPPLIVPFPESDKRFRHVHWQKKPRFIVILQLYLLLHKHLKAFAHAIPWEGRDKQQIHFCTDLLLETLCPNNCLFTNPEALRYTKQEKGLNILKGTKHFLEDIQRWQGHINLSKTNFDAFRVGKNLATTPGKVIFQNHLIELIFYQPKANKTKDNEINEANGTPILLITSWINKFYILDLQQQNSLVAWLVAQGFSVFTIAWVNPNPDHKAIGIDDFVYDGVLCALNTIKATLSCKQVHTMGYCLGGTLLSIAAAYLQAQDDKTIASMTLIATLIDFSEGGGIGNLMGPEQLKVYQKTLARTHVWDGHKMQIGFNLTNSNHFIWPFVQRRYLMGKSSMAIDSIHWGLDLANTTESMYAFYTNDLHRDNSLMRPNALNVLNTPITISQLNIPMCGVGFEEDSISPWQSAFAFIHKASSWFILAPGNHITGLITPPRHKRASHISAEVTPEHDPLGWKNQHESHKGSWWMPWCDWLLQQHTEDITSPLDAYDHAEGYDAPGHFILA